VEAIRGRSRLHQSQLFLVGVAVACGIGGAVAAIAFRILIRFFTALFFGGKQGVSGFLAEGWLTEAGDPLAQALALPAWALLVIPALGGLIVGPLVVLFPREAKGHGVPEVMEAVALRGGMMRGRAVLLRTLSSALSIGSGSSVGREGPIVQIGAALGSAIGQALRVPPRLLRTIVGCGAAAGIAATFNAPIAGALFAVEVIVGDFAVAQFSPIVIASVTATVLSRWLLGDHPSFPVPAYELVSPAELLAYAGLGVAAGLVGLAFMAVLVRAEEAFERLRLPEWGKPVLGGLMVGAIGVAFPQVFGVGYETTSRALAGALAPSLLCALLVAKLLATSIAVGSGSSGGVFAPSLFLGAMTGGALGSLVHAFFPAASAGPGAYALVGMGALVASTTHAPITAIVMIFELTQTISIIPPLMISCVTSTLLATFLARESIYTLKASRRGLNLRAVQDATTPLRRMRVRDVMARDVVRVPASARFDEVLRLVVQSPHVEFYVEDEAGRLVGAISLASLRQLIFDQDALRPLLVARDLARSDPPTLTEDDDLDTAMQILGHADLDEIAVVDAADPRRLVGSLTSQRMIDAYNDETLRHDLAGGVSSTVGVSARVRQVPLGGGYVVQEVEAPIAFLGHTLRELEVRARHGVHVVLVRSLAHPDPALRVRVPSSTDRLQEGDTLVVAGTKEAVDALMNL
jgi:CIC family chloride channel protein